MQSSLKGCIVHKPEDATTQCKVDKALEREGLEKSTDASEPVSLSPEAAGAMQTPLWSLLLLALAAAVAMML